MKNLYSSFLFSFLLLFLFNPKIDAQNPEREFVVGSFIHSSPELKYTQYNNYEQIHTLGLNAVHQLSVKELPAIPPFPYQPSNLNLLKNFYEVYAANDSGTGGYYDLNAKRPENIDWIAYFTQAKYTKWEAEGSPVFNENDGEDIKVKYEMGSTYEDPYSNRIVRRSGTSATDSGKFMIKGPDYYQYPRYTFTNPHWNPTTIIYNVEFVMKINDISGPIADVCEISVTTTYPDENDNIVEEYLVDPIILKTNDFTAGIYKSFIYSYDFGEYYDHTQPIQPYQPPTFFTPLETGQYDGLGYHIHGRTQFKVKWLGAKELFVDYIEVYDNSLWKFYFKDNYPSLVQNIQQYDQQFLTQNPAFYEKLKYYYTQDEPISIDCYEPLRKVQEIMDSVGMQADLMTHWYPGWDFNVGLSNGDRTLPVYFALANPKKLNFWFFPYVQEENGTIVQDYFGLEGFRTILQEANNYQKNFYVELQTWGNKKADGTFNRFRTPNEKMVRAQTMLAPAHGVVIN